MLHLVGCGRCAGRSRCRRCGACPRRRDGSTARRATSTQGYVLSGRQGLYLWFENPQGFPARPYRDGAGKVGGSGCVAYGRPQYVGIRCWAVRPQRTLGPLPQPVEPGPCDRGLVERLRFRCWRASGVRGTRLGYGGLGATTIRLLRPCRDEGHANPCQPLWGNGPVLLARQRRAIDADCA